MTKNLQDFIDDLKNIPSNLVEITGSYGEILEKTSHMTLAAPKSLLPYDKETIKNAILGELKIAKNEMLIESLIIGLSNLPKFINDEEANFVNEIQKHIETSLEVTPEDMEKFKSINSKISKEMEEYRKYLNKKNETF